MSGGQPAAPFAATPLDRAGGENFPVALRLLPARHREDLAAIYSFARLVDDLGDEPRGGVRPGRAEVLADLEAVRGDLALAAAGRPPRSPALAGLPRLLAAHPMTTTPFEALLRANVLDQEVSDYRTREELLGYCELSANPVGRLVLAAFDIDATERLTGLSDEVCTALQVVEHLQDIAEDARRGRIYLPAVDRDRFGVAPADLVADHATAAVRALVADEAGWAASLLRHGSRLVGALSGWSRVAVSGYVAGGAAALRALGRAGWDPLPGPPAPRRADIVRTGIAVMTKGEL